MRSAMDAGRYPMASPGIVDSQSVKGADTVVPGSWSLEKWQAAQQGYSGRLIVGADLDEIGL